MKKKVIAALLIAALSVAGLAACSAGTASEEGAAGETAASSGEAEAAGETAAEDTAADSGKTEILLWHVMSGDRLEQLEVIVDGFNASQDQYEVVAEAQGEYDEANAKFLNMAGGEGSRQSCRSATSICRRCMILGWWRISAIWWRNMTMT